MGKLQSLVLAALTFFGFRAASAAINDTAQSVDDLEPLSKGEILDIVRRAVAAYSWMVPADVMAVIETESQFNVRAINPADPSYGLMQIMLPTAKDMGHSGSFVALMDPETNIRIGAKYLDWIRRYLAERFGRAPTRSEIFGAYNAGIGNVAKGYVPVRYVDKVLTARAKWERVT